MCSEPYIMAHFPLEIRSLISGHHSLHKYYQVYIGHLLPRLTDILVWNGFIRTDFVVSLCRSFGNWGCQKREGKGMQLLWEFLRMPVQLLLSQQVPKTQQAVFQQVLHWALWRLPQIWGLHIRAVPQLQVCSQAEPWLPCMLSLSSKADNYRHCNSYPVFN